MTGLMKREDIHIKFSACWDAKCDNCGKRKSDLHEFKTPHWTKFFCDRCGSWFINKEMKEKDDEVEVQGSLPDGNNYVD